VTQAATVDFPFERNSGEDLFILPLGRVKNEEKSKLKEKIHSTLTVK